MYPPEHFCMIILIIQNLPSLINLTGCVQHLFTGYAVQFFDHMICSRHAIGKNIWSPICVNFQSSDWILKC